MADLSVNIGADISELINKVEEAKNKITNSLKNLDVSSLEGAFKKLETSLRQVGAQNEVFGKSIDTNKRELRAYQQAFDDLIASGIRPTHPEILKLADEIARLSKEIADSENKVKSFKDKIRDIGEAGQNISNLGSTLTTNLTIPILGFGAAAIKTYADIQSLKMGLEAVMGSAHAAEEEFTKLKEVAKLPGLGLKEAVQGSVSLQAAGFSANNARKSLLAFGNALATVGKGANEMNLVILALTQLQNKSSGFGQDLRQLTEQLPQLRGALIDAFGTMDTEKIAEMGVTGAQVVEKLTKEFEKLPKVTGGIKNAFENLRDSLTISLSRVGEIINKNFDISSIIEKLTVYIDKAISAFESLNPSIQKWIIGFAGVVSAIGPLLTVLGSLISLFPTLIAGAEGLAIAFSAMTGPVGLVIIAIAGLAAAYLTLRDNTKTSEDRIHEWASALEKANRSAEGEVLTLDKLYSKTQDVTLSIEDRKKAVDDLQKSYPGAFANVRDEIILNGGAADSYYSLRNAIYAAARAKAAQGELEKRSSERLEEELKLLDRQKKAFKEQLNPSPVTIGGGGGALGANMPTTYTAEQVRDQNRRIYNDITEDLAKRRKTWADEDKELLGIISEGTTSQVLELTRRGENTVKVIQGTSKAEEKARKKAERDAESARKKAERDEKSLFNSRLKASIELGQQQFKFEEKVGLERNRLMIDLAEKRLKEQDKINENERNTVLKTIEKNNEVFDKARQDQERIIEDYKNAVNELITSGIANSLSDLFSSIGTAIGEGGNVLDAIGSSLIQSIGGFIKQLGSMMIQFGVLGLLYGKLQLALMFGDPFTKIGAALALIGVGAALNILGGAISGAASGRGSSGSSNGGGTVSTSAGPETQRYTSSYSSSNSGMGGEVVFRIAGNDLYGVWQREDDRRKRIGG
ncbi:tape measure protein [Elizabethkingia meningoseptica]|uniref:tape measure protein n=1 Tax=Elizabethkingia meningoseptica TaxID=238 RepID=UPI0023B0F109|nr:tape measure protein [Elizabethkingia meningoseptica]MDE5507768.1 tape measure protein [Elizabethkingia meningoseptica]